MHGAEWRTSSFSAGKGACVEVRPTPEGAAIRHSQFEFAAEILYFTREEWDAFIAGVKAGEFDL